MKGPTESITKTAVETCEEMAGKKWNIDNKVID
jgi:hypothetical protein